MNLRRDPEVRVVVLLTGLFVLLATAFALLTPMFGNFDEQTHLDRARYAARNPTELVGPDLRVTFGSWGALIAVQVAPPPVGSEGAAQRQRYRPFRDYPGGNQGDDAPCPGVCQNIQYAHPPAWYLLAAPITAAVEGAAFPRSVLALRLFDILLCSPLVFLAWCTAREVWLRSRRRPLAVAATVALFAPLAYTASAVNNDGLLLLTMGTAIAIGARILRRGVNPRSAAALGAVVCLGLLTKVQMVLAAPALGLMVVAASATWRVRWQSVLTFAITSGLGAWWWLREIGQGGPLSPTSSELLAPAVSGPWSHASYLPYAIRELPTLASRFWGTYSGPVTFVPWPVRSGLTALVLLLVVAWLAVRRWQRPTVEGLRWWLLAAVPASLALGTLYASFDAYLRTGELRGLAPRYVYPASSVLAIGLVAALATVVRRLVPAHLRERMTSVGVVVLAVGVVTSAARAVQAAYGTSSWRDIVHRVDAVGPINHTMVVVGPVIALWAAGVVATLRALRRRDPMTELPRG